MSMSGLTSGWVMTVDLDGADQEAEVRGHRLLEREEREAAVVDLDAQEVHFLLVGEDILDEGLLAAHQGGDALVDHRLRHAAHGEEPLAQLLEIGLEVSLHRALPRLSRSGR
jgi:hypothetical protein